jgi:hypothetical protein
MRSNYQTNNGSALAIGLTILTAITLISVTALQRSGIQGRMVGNIQHKEKGFHAANGELEEIYHFYSTQASAIDALSLPINSFTMTNGNLQFDTVTAGHSSTYNNYLPTYPSGHTPSPRLQVNSSIQHTGTVDAIVEDFSYGSFKQFGFVVSAQSAKPSIGGNQGDILSNQEIGIRFIAPAG